MPSLAGSISSPIVHVLVVLVATGVIWVGSTWFERSAQDLSQYYGLPPVVQGSVVVAIGSSFPEFASVVVAGFLGVFEMGVGAIVGSALFNILVIPGLSGWLTDKPLEVSREVVYKEAQFYMIAVAALVITFALAVIYLPVEGGGGHLYGQITRPLAAVPLALYGVYLFVQYQDVSDHGAGTKPRGFSLVRSWGWLTLGLLVILLAVHQLVASVELLGSTFGVPEFLAGVTIVAAATSVPDTILSVRSAIDENGAVSLGNVLGSNTFDLLVVIPAGVMIVGTVVVNFSTAVPMFGILTVATILLFAFLRTELTLTETESIALLVVYGLFVVWIVAETLGISRLLGTI
ncbi:MAG: sodium:calcium antiporter [Halodesulfurarchaeum sp.]